MKGNITFIERENGNFTEVRFFDNFKAEYIKIEVFNLEEIFTPKLIKMLAGED